MKLLWYVYMNLFSERGNGNGVGVGFKPWSQISIDDEEEKE